MENSEWFETWFDSEDYHQLYANRDQAEADSFLVKITHKHEIPKGAKVCDLACGAGRHSFTLAQLGYQVFGYDLSEASIQTANSKMQTNPTFSVQDMRDPIPNEGFDAVFSLFTSFGYFESEHEDAQVFQNIASALRPGGVFVFDFLNPGFVSQTLVPIEVKEINGKVFSIERKISDGKVIKSIRIGQNEVTEGKEFSESVRLYYLADLLAFGNGVGLSEIAVYGDYDLGDFDAKSSPRTIIVFKSLESKNSKGE